MEQPKVLVVNGEATVRHEELEATGKIVGYNSVEDEVMIELAEDLHIVTKAKYVHQ